MATIRKHRDKYQVQVRRKGFPPVSRSFHKLADAKEWARHMETQADRQELAPNRKELAKITLGELVHRYKDEVVISKKGAEIETIVLGAFLRHSICKRSLADLNASDFAAYRDERLKTITAKSLKRQLAPINNMFEVARAEWNIPLKQNPLADLALKANDNKRERRLRDGELGLLLKAGKKTRNPLVVPIIRFAIETGMRRGEILNLRWRDIEEGRETACILETKNGFSRTIPLTPGALEVLRSLAATRGREGGTLVFPLSAIALRLSWDRLTARAGINDLNFHDLRHEAISRLFELGLTVPEVASISGHRDMRMLFRYAHASHASIRAKLASASSIG
ncbi:shufflon-specific DNA recombinase [Aminobacter sp. DSM 101952]|uniref:site-specific integrase n=1 Tax=Aminobacter sp. DSM 101952 TaxID=2735891 RepID=UPI0006F3B649|nr:site-specific integrase [Aminobacter sp. DSM 101952]KQU64840.1 shufflon-specific DNA recombinase [Aminobacter sp. DSM 101952]